MAKVDIDGGGFKDRKSSSPSQRKHGRHETHRG